MRKVLANLFRLLFKIPFFEKRFFGFHKRIFAPFKLFKGVTQTIKFKNKIFLELQVNDWIQENIFFLDKYEESELKFIKKSINKGDVFIDIGANIGIHSLFASNLVGEKGKVISFEPFSINYNSLIKNISLNNSRNIVLEKLAISAKESLVNIFYNCKDYNFGMASSYLTNYTNSEKVKSTTLDLYLKNKSFDRIDFIKLDIEGGEYPALLGMKNSLKKYHPILLVEILDNNTLTQSDNEKNIINFFKKIGYVKYFIKNNGELSLVEKNNSRMNYAFIKN